MRKNNRGPRDPINLLEGIVEVWVRKQGVVIDHFKVKNIILYQGMAEILRSLVYTTPTTKPRLITRMAVGDQGTIPSDSTIAKVPVKTATGLYHEFYRKDVDSFNPTLYTPTGLSYTGTTTTGSSIITNMSSIMGITSGMVVTGTGIPVGAVVDGEPPSPTTIKISLPATSDNTGTTINFSGSVNECQFIAEFDAVDVPLTAFSNPAQPRLNEVGLVIIDPTASSGIARAPVIAPSTPATDEVVMSLRTFKSVPFEAANDISVTIKYTIFMQ